MFCWYVGLLVDEIFVKGIFCIWGDFEFFYIEGWVMEWVILKVEFWLWVYKVMIGVLVDFGIVCWVLWDIEG